MSCLVFHHLRDKKIRLDTNMMAGSSLETLQAEVNKCILLCHNCHTEIHNPDLSLETVINTYKNISIIIIKEPTTIHKCRICNVQIKRGANVCSSCYKEHRKEIRKYTKTISKETIIEMYKTKTISEINRETGVGRKRISKILKNEGFDISNKN